MEFDVVLQYDVVTADNDDAQIDVQVDVDGGNYQYSYVTTDS